MGTGYRSDKQNSRKNCSIWKSDGNDGNKAQDNGGQYFGPMFPMEVEEEFLKTKVPTVEMYHKSIQCCEAEECCYHWNAKYMEPPPPQHVIQDALLQNGVGSKKNKNIIGKTSYQMPIFAFIRWIGYRRLSLVLSANTCTWAITIFRV